MDIRFNPRDNGACPLCTKIDDCMLRRRIAKSTAELKDPKAIGMDLVIYTCPLFEEKP